MPPRAGRYGLGGDFDEAAHPRWPRGAPDDASGDGQGGRFRDRVDAVRGWAEELADSMGVGHGTRPAGPRRTGYNDAVMQAARDQIAANNRSGRADPDLETRYNRASQVRSVEPIAWHDVAVDQLRAHIAQRYPERDRQLPRDIPDHHDGTPSPDPRHTRLTSSSTETPQPAQGRPAPRQPVPDPAVDPQVAMMLGIDGDWATSGPRMNALGPVARQTVVGGGTPDRPTWEARVEYLLRTRGVDPERDYPGVDIYAGYLDARSADEYVAQLPGGVGGHALSTLDDPMWMTPEQRDLEQRLHVSLLLERARFLAQYNPDVARDEEMATLEHDLTTAVTQQAQTEAAWQLARHMWVQHGDPLAESLGEPALGVQLSSAILRTARRLSNENRDDQMLASALSYAEREMTDPNGTASSRAAGLRTVVSAMTDSALLGRGNLVWLKLKQEIDDERLQQRTFVRHRFLGDWADRVVSRATQEPVTPYVVPPVPAPEHENPLGTYAIAHSTPESLAALQALDGRDLHDLAVEYELDDLPSMADLEPGRDPVARARTIGRIRASAMGMEYTDEIVGQWDQGLTWRGPGGALLSTAAEAAFEYGESLHVTTPDHGNQDVFSLDVTPDGRLMLEFDPEGDQFEIYDLDQEMPFWTGGDFSPPASFWATRPTIPATRAGSSPAASTGPSNTGFTATTYGWDDQGGDHWLPTGAHTLQEMAQNLADARITSGFGPDQDEHPVMDTVRRVFDYEDFDTGYYTEVGSATWQPASHLWVEGKIRAADGTVAGSFRRYMYPDGHVYHAYLKISDPGAQGGGFTARWFEQVKQQYREQGFDRVTVHANIDVGGYAWAKLGFDFEDDDAAGTALALLRGSINRAAGDPFRLGLGSGYALIDVPEVDQATMRELERLERRIRNGEHVSAAEIAMLGYDQRWATDTDVNDPTIERGGEMWLGKAFMLRYSWSGEMRL